MQPQPFSLPFTADAEGCSRAGAEHALPRAGSQLARVFQTLQDHGPLTDRELVQVTGLPLNVINARRWQLVQQGLVAAVGTVKAASGVLNTRWQVTT